jgi:pilus assembly protein CpaB
MMLANMNSKKMTLLLTAFLIAGMTIIVARNMMSKPQMSAGGAPVMQAIEVAVAARDLPAGTLVKDADLKWQNWPAEATSSNLFVKGKNDKIELVGSVVRNGMRAGEPMMAGRVVRPHEQGFLSAVLNPGQRAVSVAISPTGGVAGLVFPGDRVDVIMIHQIGSGAGENGIQRKVSETVLTNVRVLALDQKTDDQSNEAKIAQIATLEVSPKDAEKITLISEIGTLSLVLRSLAIDDSVAGTNGTAETINGGKATPVADSTATPKIDIADLPEAAYTWDSDVSQVLPKPVGFSHKIQVLRGKESSEVTF